MAVTTVHTGTPLSKLPLSPLHDSTGETPLQVKTEIKFGSGRGEGGIGTDVEIMTKYFDFFFSLNTERKCVRCSSMATTPIW